MTTGGLITFSLFLIGFILFGVYAGTHREEDKDTQKQKHV